MELDVTHMVEEADNMFELSGNKLEHGQDAGRITWTNSLAYGQEKPLLKTEEERNQARAHFREYGAWSEDEIAAWSEDELQGLMCQDVASAIREMEMVSTYEEYQRLAERGTVSGNLYRSNDGRWYYYLGV